MQISNSALSPVRGSLNDPYDWEALVNRTTQLIRIAKNYTKPADMFPSTNMTAIFIAMQKIMTALQNPDAMELLQKFGYVS